MTNNRKVWIISGVLLVLVLGLLVFTRVRFEPGLELLFSLATLLGGVGVVSVTLARWALRSATRVDLVGGLLTGLLVMALGILGFWPAETIVHHLLRLTLVILFLGALAYWIRAGRAVHDAG